VRPGSASTHLGRLSEGTPVPPAGRSRGAARRPGQARRGQAGRARDSRSDRGM